jgi:hypothetical protein
VLLFDDTPSPRKILALREHSWVPQATPKSVPPHDWLNVRGTLALAITGA